MNFALPAVLVILGLVPGILSHKGYFSGKFPREISSDSPIVEFATYFLFALPIDALSLALLSEVQRRQAFEILLDLAAANLDKEGLVQVVSIVSAGWFRAAFIYFAVCVTAFLAGVIMRRIVWTCRLDVWLPALRMKSDDYYILQGRLRGFPRRVLPYTDILASTPGAEEGSRLYSGIITQFSFDPNGELREVVLAQAKRGKGRDEEFKWKDIPSDQFILIGGNIHSINMRYFSVVEETTGWFLRFRYWIKGIFFSLVLEEP